VTAGRLVGDNRERGSGTILAAGLALVVLMAAVLVILLAQSAVQASRAASAADRGNRGSDSTCFTSS
jgi:hypothetical protein